MTCSEKNPRSPECAIPEWAQTENPRELAFYQHHLESLSKSLHGINVIARTLYHMEMSNAFEPGDHDWWNSYLRDGLLTAISQLAMDTAHPLEFMIERAKQFAPKEDEAIHEISIPITKFEYGLLDLLGKRAGLTGEQLLEQWLKAGINRVELSAAND